jgi:hypothetical protein
MAGSEASEGTVNIVDIPESAITFRCGRYSVGRLSQQLDVMNVFSPSTIQSRRLIMMTHDFSLPYRITNLLYVTAPDVQYAFVGSQEAQAMRRMMPNESFSTIHTSLGEVERDGTKARFIVFDGSITDGTALAGTLSGFASLPDDAVSALSVSGSLESGDIIFFRKSGSQFREAGRSSYVSREGLLGAVYTDNPELYRCTMDNVFEKSSIVTQIYRSRTEDLRQDYAASGDRCANLQGTAYSLQPLDKILAATASFTKENGASMQQAARTLEQQNTEAQRRSCATIY